MSNNFKQISFIDHVIMQVDQMLKTLTVEPIAERTNPSALAANNDKLSPDERAQSAKLMRVNHAGEVSAQALYHGQSLTAHSQEIRERLTQSASEEGDHLAWCQERIKELNGQVSYLNPVWYLGSFLMGCLAGVAGDRWSLAFLAETEHQVVDHLKKHLEHLPAHDQRSRLILEQMSEDEAHHATVAISAGAADLPAPVKVIMKMISKVMTTTAYWV